jgi:hypothetical protein
MAMSVRNLLEFCEARSLIANPIEFILSGSKYFVPK